MDFIDTFTVTKEPNSQVKIEGEIPFASLQEHRTSAIKALGKNVELDGFRKGHVPEDILIKKIGEMHILNEMAERALALIYPKVIELNKLEAIGHPEIKITKLAPENPLCFTATVATIPEITLPDYKALASELNKDKQSAEVTEEELQKQIEEILRQKIAYERMQAKAQNNTDTKAVEVGDETDLPTPETVDKPSDKNKTHTHEDGTVHAGPAHDDEDLSKIELPELTDEYVKGLGQPGQFETVEDFKTKLREHIGIEKEKEVIAAHRAKITDKIIDESKLDLPQILIDSEINQMFGQMNEDLDRANLKLDDYLTHLKKTKEDLVEEWKPAAEKRARLQLILNEIAKKDEVKPDQGQLDQQVDQLLEQYKDADQTRVRVYVESVMTNEAVMKMLENL